MIRPRSWVMGLAVGIQASLAGESAVPTGAALAGGDVQETVGLADAINEALDHNRELAKNKLGVEASRLGVSVARANFSYRFAPVGNASATQDGDTLEAGVRVSRRNRLGQDVQLRVQGEQDGAEEETLRRGRASLQLTQPIFRNFGRLVNEEPLVRAHAELRRARRGLEGEIDNLILRVAETFLDILRLENRIVSDEAFLKRADHLLEITRLRERQGRATRVDTLRVSLQRGEAATRLEQSRERLHLARFDFRDLLGAPTNVVHRLVPPPLDDAEPPSVDLALATAFSNRLDYAQALDDARDQQRNLVLARKNLQPDLAIVGRYERFGEGSGFADAARFDQDNWVVGLAANKELNPALESANLGRAELDLRASGDDALLLAITIRRRVQQEIMSARSARQELALAEKNRALALSRAQLAQRLFRMGRGDNFSVTDAEESYLQAENAWQDAQAAWTLSTYRLRREMGTLKDSPDDLKPRPLGALEQTAR